MRSHKNGFKLHCVFFMFFKFEIPYERKRLRKYVEYTETYIPVRFRYDPAIIYKMKVSDWTDIRSMPHNRQFLWNGIGFYEAIFCSSFLSTNFRSLCCIYISHLKVHFLHKKKIIPKRTVENRILPLEWILLDLEVWWW